MRDAVRVTLALTLIVCSACMVQTPPVPTYDQYSMLNHRSAGQLWTTDGPVTQWAWTPQPDGRTQIRWGDPATWPPPNYEQFTRSGDWVLLEGYGDDTGQFARQVVTRELLGNVDCARPTTLPPDPLGRQRYTRWTIPTQPYCLQAWGHIDYAGTRVDFHHRQVWFPPGSCRNTYLTDQTCLKQYEVWSDNNGDPGGVLIERHRRDNILAQGIGPGFILHDYRTGWHAELRHHWAW